MENENIYSVLNSINSISPLVLLVIGALGNTFSFIIYKRIVFRDRTIGKYLSTLAVFDTLSLVQYFISRRIKYRKDDVVLCGLMNFLTIFLPCICSWLTMLTSLDRYIATASPLNIQLLNKKWLQNSIITIVIMLQIVFNSHIFLISVIVLNVNNGDYNCFFYMPSFMTNILYIRAINQTLIPAVVMVFSTVYVSKYLIGSKERKNRNFKSSKETQFALTTLFINSFFFVCYVPYDLYMILSQVYSAFIDPRYFVGSINWFITESAIKILLYAHSTIPFFVYLTVNRLFRCEVVSLLMRMTNYVFKTKIIPSSNNRPKTTDTGVDNQQISRHLEDGS